jgi:hypothetical protein
MHNCYSLIGICTGSFDNCTSINRIVCHGVGSVAEQSHVMQLIFATD